MQRTMTDLEFIEPIQLGGTYSQKHLSGSSSVCRFDSCVLSHQIMAVFTFEKLDDKCKGGQYRIATKRVLCLNTITTRLEIDLRDSLLFKRSD
jgi:hypothetical protein